jgi:hypothetical protein
MGGLNVSNLSNFPIAYSITTTSNTGFHIGALVNVNLGSRFDFQAQVLYSQLGCTTSQSAPDSIATFTQTDNMTLSYLLIPLYFNYKFKSGWNIHAGPYLSFLLTDKEALVQTYSAPGYNTLELDSSTNTTQGDNKFDIGFSIGMGYTMQNGLGFNFSYSTGLVNVSQAQTYTDPNSGQVIYQPAFGLNNWFSFSISYLFK